MIRFDNVSYCYSNSEKGTLDDVSLTIPDGECVLLCGISGCGKTTVTRMINGLIPQYYEGDVKGSVQINDVDVTKAELYDTAKQVGSVFQNPSSQFFCVDTTSEIAFGCENMGLPEREILHRIDEVTKELHINKLLGRNIFQLSGGEKQKIACASVSALHPDIMVLDEPTSNLDMHAIEDLRQILMQWKKQGKTIVIAEHRLYWLKDICDRVLYMRNGKILQDLTMKEFSSLSPAKIRELGLRSLQGGIEKTIVSSNKSIDAIQLLDFFYQYGKKVALNIPKLSAPSKEIIAVIGQNGAGKSTFSKCLCGVQKGFKGSIVLDGKEYNSRQLIRVCYMVMQDVNHQLFCESVEEEVKLGMMEENQNIVLETLDRLDLTDVMKRHPMSLSGGQKQRVAVASALLTNKQVLIFDEPTSALHYQHMEQTADLLLSLRGEKTVLIVTHDPELIERCCTYVLQMEGGEIVDFYPADNEGRKKLSDFLEGSKEGYDR